MARVDVGNEKGIRLNALKRLGSRPWARLGRQRGYLVREALRTPRLMIVRPRLLIELHEQGRQHRTGRAAAVLHHRDVLVREVHHRVGNSLQILASILALDARKVRSEEARLHLEKARKRILAIATLEQQLQASRNGGEFELAAYLRQLCQNLSASVVGGGTRIGIDVQADAGTVSSDVATNVGLIVGELVINAVKHAFVADTGRILVTYHVEGERLEARRCR
jgi:two-component sensor histidine kinase